MNAVADKSIVITEAILGQPVRDGGRRENLAEQAGELAPLLVLAAAADAERHGLEPLQRLDLQLQFLDRAGGGGGVQNLLLDRLKLDLGGVVEVLNVVGVERTLAHGRKAANPTAALENFHLAQAAFEALAATAQRLIDGLRR